jgi:hypothetical protein
LCAVLTRAVAYLRVQPDCRPELVGHPGSPQIRT